MKKGIFSMIASGTFLLCLFSTAGAADIAVVVNKANNNTIDKNMLAKIYMGGMFSWPRGGKITPVDLPEQGPSRADFTIKVIGKNLHYLKAVWAQNIFTGKGLPPKVLASNEEVLRAVAANKGAIGYVDAASVTDDIKVVMQLK